MPQIIEFLEYLDFHQYIPSSHTKKQAKKNHQTLGIVNLGFFWKNDWENGLRYLK